MVKSFKENFIEFIASGFKIGTFKYPLGGIWGIGLGIIIAILINDWPLKTKLLFIVLGILITIPVSSRAEVYFHQGKDPHCIVIDEINGVLISSLLINLDKVLFVFNKIPLPIYLIVVLVYGFFDGLKPFPIYRLQKLPRGLGIVIDDLIAGIYSLGILSLLSTFLNF